MADILLKVDIITPQSVVFSGEAISVNVPGSLSPFEVLINHAPIVSSLDSGVIKIKLKDNSLIYFASGTGFIEVNKNIVSILVETAVNALEIDKDKVLAAIDKIKSELTQTSNNNEQILIASKLSVEQAKLKAATIIRRN
jgi:F-type H+-transporting ATPase subunit epsilon